MDCEHEPEARQPQPPETGGPGSDTTARAAPTVHKATTRLRLRQPPHKSPQSRIRRWLKVRRGGEEAERSAVKSLNRVIAIVVTALISFFFGMANNQASDIIKRADECYQALSQYEIGVVSDYIDLTGARHRRDPQLDLTEGDIRNNLNAKYNAAVGAPFLTANNKCPIDRNDYLHKDDVEVGKQDYDNLMVCYYNDKCALSDQATFMNDAVG